MDEQKKRPSGAAIDALIDEYAEAQKVVTAAKTATNVAQEAADRLKERLVKWVEEFGRRHAEKSMRLEGIHNKATTTTSVVTTTDPDAVEKLHEFLEKQELVELEGKLFRKQVTYTLVASPEKVLAEVSLAGRIRARLTSLVKSCLKTVTRAPSLKVEVAKVEDAKGKAA